MSMFAEAVRPFPLSVYPSAMAADPLYPVVGVKVRFFNALLRLVRVPLIVIADELFAPELNVIPVVAPSFSLPFVAESVTCWIAVPALMSVTRTWLPLVLLKVRVVFCATDCVVGAV